MESTSRGVIHQGNSTISIEMLPEYPHPVVVKKPSKCRASRSRIRSLETEYEITRSLDGVDGVRKVLERRSIKSQPALILEYIDGQTLRDLIAKDSLGLRSKLQIAIQLTRILGRIHQQNVVHLDFNSRNILVGREPEAIHIIDLGAASSIDGGDHPKVRPDQLLGTLPYISPEQTGRINRVVDERSDLYSLGVVLYELMTGRLPFESDNPQEIIHHHIALTPVPPSAVSSDIPDVISAIIMKLLKKDAEDRYQSATGVQADLETCLQRLAPDNSIEEFQVGEADSTTRFKYPQALYGRDRELKELEGALGGACRDTSAVVFVCGYSGIGKTVLVEEIQRPVSEKRGHFIRGKFDQYLRTTPYAAISQAFTGFASQILAEPEKSFADWKSRIQSAVGNLGGVLTAIIPTLEKIIGTQPPVPQLGGQEAENRFNYVFINFLACVATEDHPLVLFLDDLQWIDAASLRSLAVIQSELHQPGLLVIGAYRDNEVGATHPLMGMLGAPEDEKQRPRILKLDNLQQDDLRAFIADTLKSESGVTELATAIHDKTQGNPFFSRRLLSSLYDEGRIRYDLDSKAWQWANGDLNVAAVADTVADLLARTLAHLPEEQKHLLNLAACIGNRFDLPTLTRISGRTDQEITRQLTAFVRNQYVTGSENGYEFVHDQVQQAAYTLTDAERRAGTHLMIGRQLLADMSDAELEEQIFGVVNQYNLGVELLTDRDEVIKLATLNLEAGRKSRASSAFAAAAQYLQQSATLLGDGKWQDHYRLTLTVFSELIEACHLNQQKEDVRALFDTLVEHVTENADLCSAYKTLIVQKIGDSDLGEAIALAEHYLETLGINFDDARHSSMSVAELYALPPMKDREKLAALDILLTITTPVIFSAPARLPSLIYTMLNLISRYGNSGMAGVAYAWYAVHLCFVQQYREGNLFGQLGVDLLAKYPSPGIAAKIMDLQYSWVRHWESPAQDLIAPLKTYFQVGMEEGDFEWALYCLLNHGLLLWGAGEPLERFMAEAEPGIELSRSKNQEVTLFMFLLFAQSALNLTGTAVDPTRLEGTWFSEKRMMSKLEGNHLLLALYGLLKITRFYLFGSPGEACRHIEDTLKYRSSLNPHYLYSKISFYGALSCVAELAIAADDANLESRREQLKQFERELELWAEVAPMNYEHEYQLLQAEKSRVANQPWKAVQSYERAIQGAHENHFVHEEALAKELYARFWQGCGNDDIAAMYMREARILYHQWGAAAKVHQLENRYPQWFGARDDRGGHEDAASGVLTSISQPITSIARGDCSIRHLNLSSLDSSSWILPLRSS
jgi:predicted ATPase